MKIPESWNRATAQMDIGVSVSGSVWSKCEIKIGCAIDISLQSYLYPYLFLKPGGSCVAKVFYRH
jgi:hypothetical protein